MKLPVNYTILDSAARRAVREQYIQLQKGKCMWCGEALDSKPPKSITDKKVDWRLFPRNFLRYPVHLQHNHDTGMTEGAVHAYCNAVMWQYHSR